MTINAVITIDVSHLADHVRKCIPEQINATYAMCEAGNFCIGVPRVPIPVYETLYTETPSGRLASSIAIDVNVADFLVGPKFEQSSSVFASGRAALELVRIELARAGLPKSDLDRLSTKHVSIQQVRVPFMFRFVNEQKASTKKPRRNRVLPQSDGFEVEHVATGAEIDVNEFMKAMPQFAFLLGLNTCLTRGRQIVEYRACKEEIRGQNIVLIVECRPIEKMVRIDVLLDEEYLRSHAWERLDSWCNAYAEHRYEFIFHDTVRKMFRLDEQGWQLNEPREEVYNNAPDVRARDLLREYVAGKNPIYSSCFTFEANRSDATKKTAVRKYRIAILSMLGIDINTPWTKEQHRLRNYLSRILKYPCDFRPDAIQAKTYFCQANFDQLLINLCHAYQESGPAAD